MTKDQIVEGTLRWCNRQRKRKGMWALKQLPKGKRNDANSCPCGQATGMEVYDNKAYDGEDRIAVTRAVSRFVTKFDSGKLPEFDIEPEHSRILNLLR